MGPKGAAGSDAGPVIKRGLEEDAELSAAMGRDIEVVSDAWVDRASTELRRLGGLLSALEGGRLETRSVDTERE